jgi:hypothetical protein
MKVRFSIRGLLVLVTAIVLFLGFSQYRRREILKVVADLKSDDYVFPVKDNWFDRYVWQRKPIAGTIAQGGDAPAVVCKMVHWGKTYVFVTYNKKVIARFEKSELVSYSDVPPPNPDPLGLLKQ